MALPIEQALSDIFRTHGAVLLEDPRQVAALLMDMCPYERARINVLISALEHGAVPKLQVLSNSKLLRIEMIARAGQELAEDTGLDRQMAKWGIETWAGILEKIAIAEQGASAIATPISAEGGISEGATQRESESPISPRSTMLQTLIAQVDKSILEQERQRDFNIYISLTWVVEAHKKGIPDAAFTSSVGLSFAAIPPGSFPADSAKGEAAELPVRKVVISSAFLMSTSQINQKQFRAVMGVNPSCFRGDDLPVDSVSWDDAVNFCLELSKREHELGTLPLDYDYRLPTEAEWEYCCRAGNALECCFGGDDALLEEYAWFRRNSETQTHPVGQKKANAWGLYDMHGNVWEWCYYWHEDRPQAAEQIHPRGLPRNISKVARGGAFDSDSDLLRCDSRLRFAARARGGNNGFRVVCAAWSPDKVTGRKILPYYNLGLVPIEPGSFLMGAEDGADSEKPVHQVTISRRFFIGAAPVTQTLFEEVLDEKASIYRGGDFPVESASWEMASEFCRELTRLERMRKRLPVGFEYRLPTEAEWEYCCRAGSQAGMYPAPEAIILEAHEMYIRDEDDGAIRPFREAQPVGSRKPNAWGLYDMHGNVEEWCLDRFGPYSAEPQIDPRGPAEGETRVAKGGPWYCDLRFFRTTRRSSWKPAHEAIKGGFRVVCARIVR